MSAPIPNFCANQSYDEIRLNNMQKHSARRQKIEKESEALYSHEPTMHKHRQTFSVNSRYMDEKVQKVRPEDDVRSNLSCKNTDKLVLRAFTRSFNTACQFVLGSQIRLDYSDRQATLLTQE